MAGAVLAPGADARPQPMRPGGLAAEPLAPTGPAADAAPVVDPRKPTPCGYRWRSADKHIGAGARPSSPAFTGRREEHASARPRPLRVIPARSRGPPQGVVRSDRWF